MKKCLKKIISIVLAAAALTSIAIISFAESTVGSAKPDRGIVWSELPDEPTDLSEYKLISEESYTDSGSGLFFVDKTYVKENSEGAAVQGGYKPFSKDVTKTRSIYKDPSSAAMGDLLFIMYVEGTFTSKDIDHISVSAKKPHTEVVNVYIGSGYKDKKFCAESDCGANALWGYKYAYIEYIITVKFPDGHEENVRLWLDVNVMGDEHVSA